MEERIKNMKDYEEFRKIFEIFKFYPFYEKWTEKGFEEEFEYLKKYGEIFGYYNNLGDVTGLISLVYGASDKQPVRFKQPEKVMYVSDLAVLENYRCKGMGTKLLKFAISYTRLLNYYNEMYMRTNLEGSMSEGIFIKQGFEVMKENGKIIIQDVYFERTNNLIPEIDTRKFLLKRIDR